MKRLRVVILTDESLVPPPDYAGADYTDEPWRMERDIEVALRSLGHEVRMLGVVRNLEAIEEVEREWRPHVAFNLLEDVYGVIAYDHNMVSFLELMGLAYTGCNPLGLVVSRDKALTKKLVAYHRIAVPRFLVCRQGRAVHRPNLPKINAGPRLTCNAGPRQRRATKRGGHFYPPLAGLATAPTLTCRGAELTK